MYSAMELTPVATANLVPVRPEEQLINLWLHGRSKHTQRAYKKDAQSFLTWVAKPIDKVTLADLQSFSNWLSGSDLKPASIYRILSSIKSLLAFGHRIGILPYDVGSPLRLPAFSKSISNRILEVEEVQMMIAMEPNARNKALLTLLYAGGFRISEVLALVWGDLQKRDSGGQATVFGKGGKTRTVLLPSKAWDRLQTIRRGSNDHEPVFKSRTGNHLDPSMGWRIARRAAIRAGITKDVSPHWYRHAHCSHSLDSGAPIHLVQQTVGHSSVGTTCLYLHARPNESSSTFIKI